MLLMLALTAGGVFARTRVGMRLPAAQRPAEAIGRIGGQTLESYPMQVNGVNATLTVFGLEQPAAAAVARLRPLLSLPEGAVGDGLQFQWEAGGRALSLILLPIRADQSIALLVDAAAAEWRAQHQRALAPPAPNWPLPPQGALRFTARNDATRSALGIADSPAAPREAAHDVAAQLRRAGWQPVAGDPDLGQQLFSRSAHETCMMVALPVPGGGSRVAVLQRRGAAP